MKKVLVGIVVAVLILMSALLASVNLAPNDNVKKHVIANYCAEMTKSLMKSPASYKLESYSIDRFAPTAEEIATQERITPSLSEKENLIWAKIIANESFLAKNPMGVEVRGSSKCIFMRAELGLAPHFYSLSGFFVNGTKVSDINLIIAETDANKSAGSLTGDVTYMQKIKYIFNSMFN